MQPEWRWDLAAIRRSVLALKSGARHGGFLAFSGFCSQILFKSDPVMSGYLTFGHVGGCMHVWDHKTLSDLIRNSQEGEVFLPCGVEASAETVFFAFKKKKLNKIDLLCNQVKSIENQFTFGGYLVYQKWCKNVVFTENENMNTYYISHKIKMSFFSILVF